MAGKLIKDKHPPVHQRSLLRRGDHYYTITPCYGMHAPWAVVRTLTGEAEPVAFEPTDEWWPLPLTPEAIPELELVPPPPPPTPEILSPEEILRLGALTLEQEQSAAVDQQLADLRQVYQDNPKGVLIEALLARDRQLLHMGRQVADGRTASRLLREFMRAALYRADGQARNPAQLVESALRSIGAEPADARQVMLHGSTLGPLEPPELVAEDLASGERKQR